MIWYVLQSFPAISTEILQEIVYDAKSNKVVKRTLKDRENNVKKIWSDGKIKTYTLQKQGRHGKLQTTADWL